MKNKKLTYILLPLVIIVWGLVFYRIFFDRGNNTNQVVLKYSTPEIEENAEEKEEYQLIANYRDPFLHHQVFKKEPEENFSEEKNENTNNLRRRRTSISRTRWPEINYGGFVEDNKGEKSTILLSVDNRNYLLNKGDTINNLIIKEFYKDSIIIVYKEEDKTFIK